MRNCENVACAFKHDDPTETKVSEKLLGRTDTAGNEDQLLRQPSPLELFALGVEPVGGGLLWQGGN